MSPDDKKAICNKLTAFGNRLDYLCSKHKPINTDTVLNAVVAVVFNKNTSSVVTPTFINNNVRTRKTLTHDLTIVNNMSPNNTIVNNELKALKGSLKKYRFVHKSKNAVGAISLRDIGNLLHKLLKVFSPQESLQSASSADNYHPRPSANSQASNVASSSSIELIHFPIKKQLSDIKLARETADALDSDEAKKNSRADD